PADPTRAVVKGLTQGFSSIRLNPGSDNEETLEAAVYPEKITEDKVLILSAGADYFMHMSSRKTIARVKNSDEKVLEVRSVRDSPDCISFRTLKAGFTRLELGAEDNSTESFAIFVVNPPIDPALIEALNRAIQKNKHPRGGIPKKACPNQE